MSATAGWLGGGDADDGSPKGRALRFHATRALIALGVAATTYLLFPASPAVDSPILEVGSVAPDNVIAPFGYSVLKSPDELEKERNDIVRSVVPIFGVAPAAVDTSRQLVSQFTDGLRRIMSSGEPQRVAAIQQLGQRFGVQLTTPEAQYLSVPGRAETVSDAVRRVYDRWLANGIAANGVLDAIQGTILLRRDGAETSANVDSIPTFSTLLVSSRLLHPDPGSVVGDATYRKLLTAFFRPTIVFDRVATERARQELRRSVPTVKYSLQQGEKIVGAHEVVGREERQKMRALQDELAKRGEGRFNVNRIIGAVLFNTLVLTIFGLTLWLFRPQLYASARVVSLFAIVFLIVIGTSSIIAHVPQRVHPELIPVAFAAVIVSILFDPRIGMIAAMVLAMLIGGQSEFRGTNALFLNLIGGTAAAFTVRIVRHRNQSHLAMFAIAGAYLIAAVAIGLTLDLPMADIGASAGWGALNAVASVSIAMMLLPGAEQFAGVDTDFTLLEWSDLNRPLLRRLSLEAPGTYAHTIAIANLAESASNAVGGNGLLARVGALYHDIGKLKKPQYFAENQAKGRNPHDKLKPTTSASIIRNHVLEGLELAEEHKLPRGVLPFIREHHGTGPISYFLEKAKERDGLPANTAEFVYPGPSPRSIETAIVMLADGAEAAARVLNDPTPQKIREVIDRIVRQRMDQGQLREAPITQAQLETVKDQFTRVLAGMYHSRIEYPAASGGITAEFGATPEPRPGEAKAR
ncbi:MAG TPA: HDIG domain-containing protein [Gemmatimonadaceae bacterium]|nr:HDIG domain-containing protein [Gemmatimonadaceae bacterium]